MKVRSFIKRGIEWCPVEIELNFLPGLPQFHFLGLPDMALKESQLRIKSAIKHQGFEWPKAKQVVVNMRPNNIRKSSQGLELAIACAFLWATQQVEKSPLLNEIPWVYGELGLRGEVFAPADVYRAEIEVGDDLLVTGEDRPSLPFSTLRIRELRDLLNMKIFPSEDSSRQRDLDSVLVLPERFFCKSSGDLLSVVGTGEHNALFVGPAGSGKTVLAESLKYVLADLDLAKSREVRRWALTMDWPFDGRPFVAPHHSTPNISMIGGGSPPLPGEITRAHNGVLFLDELLEFSSTVKESLREPIQEGKISVSRRGERKEFPAEFILLAASNLCPCGSLVPGRMNGCRFSLIRCRSYTERLSGPLADRFSIMSYSHTWKKHQELSLKEIKKRVSSARAFALSSRGQKLSNEKVEFSMIQSTMNPLVAKSQVAEVVGSRRRSQSLLRVARSLADLEASAEIKPEHVLKAKAYSLRPFDKLQEIFA